MIKLDAAPQSIDDGASLFCEKCNRNRIYFTNSGWGQLDLAAGRISFFCPTHASELECDIINFISAYIYGKQLEDLRECDLR